MRKIGRRKFLWAGAGLLGAATLAGCGSSLERLMPSGGRDSPGGRRVVDHVLKVALASNDLGGRQVLTTTYNGKLTGPTIRVRPGDQLRVLVQNELPVTLNQSENQPDKPYTTNLHTHGLHVSPSSPSDDIFVAIDPGEDFQYIYDIPQNQAAGTLFYHPHVHGSTALQMWGGMSGALIIEGDVDEVPEIKAARDLLFFVQEIRVDDAGVQPEFTANFVSYLRAADPVYTVNGEVTPTIEARPGEVIRLRVVHSGVLDYLNFAIDSHELHAIAYDGITLATPELEESIVLAGSNRVDVMVRAGAPGNYPIRSLAYDQGFGPNEERLLANLVVSGEPVTMGLPRSLPAPYTHISQEEVTNRRQLTFEVGPASEQQPVATFVIDGKLFDDDRVDQTVNLEAVEEWTVYNDSEEDHPFHIHVNDFLVTQIGDEILDPPRWHDTINLPKYSFVRFLSRFEDFPGRYVLHCHILVHECVGMMQVVEVVAPEMSLDERAKRSEESRRLVARMNKPIEKRQKEFCSTAPLRRLRWGGPTMGA